MATPQKPKQPSSKWGFLSQAVASVESGLDRILAEEDEAPKKPAPNTAKSQENGSTDQVKRSDSANRTNDRLQARLAQAMVKKAGTRATTSQPDSEPPSRPDTPGMTETPAEEAPGAGSKPRFSSEESREEEPSLESTDTLRIVNAHTPDANPVYAGPELGEIGTTSTTAPPHSSDLPQPSADGLRLSREDLSHRSLTDTNGGPDAKLLDAQLEHEKSLADVQQEVNDYLERIDALQRNMQMLTKDTIQRTKQVKNDSDATPHEKQLAEQDEKIALLIEEGTKLTKSEMQYRTTIKNLRAQASTMTKEQDAVRQRAEKAEKSVSLAEARTTKAETDARKASVQVAILSKSASDVEAITKERGALQATLAEVRSQLNRATRRAEEAESKAQSDKLEAEQRKNAELQANLITAKAELDSVQDKFKREIESLRQNLTREKEQTRHMETEMLAEQAALESRLESFRVRAEEATTGDIGDSQAKLLRQIETLQSQYSTASQNWQGIESTLLGRITAAERERDEVVGREADLRRKLRDATNKARNASKELEDVQQSLNTLQDQEADEGAELQKAEKRTAQLEAEVVKLHTELEEQRLRAEKDIARRLQEEKAKWIASVPQSLSRVDSPAASIRKGAGGSFVDSLVSPTAERPISRRSSHQPFYDMNTNIGPSRIDPAASTRASAYHTTTSAMPETPSIMIPDDQDDFFANAPATPASAGLTQPDSARRGINDMISASTAAAGPSVQLVERLSTNVRRLESEKAASKDEIARLGAQRDQARQEVVNLMREMESKRDVEQRLNKMEKEHISISEKYDQTLELLGEKTEQVEELKADILDVKQMYRHLADTMGK